MNGFAQQVRFGDADLLRCLCGSSTTGPVATGRTCTVVGGVHVCLAIAPSCRITTFLVNGAHLPDATGAEQLRVPSRDLPHMPLNGPSRLRNQSSSSLEQQEAARQANTAAPAGAAAGSYLGTVASPQQAAAAMTAAQFNAAGGGSGSSSSAAGKHVWFQTLPPQQPQTRSPAQPGATCNMIMVSGTSNLALSPSAAAPMPGTGMAILPYGDSMAMLAGGSPDGHGKQRAAAAPVSTGNNSNSGCWVVCTPAQQGGDSRRSSLCESSASSMVAMTGAVGQQVALCGSNGSIEQRSGAAALQLPATSLQQGAAPGSGSLAGMSNIGMLLSSLVQEIKTTRQEAVDSRNAAVQAQEQLKAITEALSYQGLPAQQGAASPVAAVPGMMAVAGDVGGAPMAASLQAAVGAAGAGGAARNQLQLQAEPMCLSLPMVSSTAPPAAAQMQGCLDQLSLVQQLQATRMLQSDPAAAAGLNQAVSDSSNMSCSGNWTLSPAPLNRLPSAGAAVGPDPSRLSFEQALGRGVSLDQATARQLAGSGAAAGPYPVAGGSGVVQWLHLVPNTAAVDAAVMAAGMPLMEGPATAAGAPQGAPWRSSFDAGRLSMASAAASGITHSSPGVAHSSSSLLQPQRQQQLTSDYLLQLQRTHGLLSAPELAFIGSAVPRQQQQQQHDDMQVHSAAAALHGWGAAGAKPSGHSSGTMEGLLSPSGNTAHLNTADGSRSLGWL